MFNVGQNLSIKVGGSDIVGELVGIDYYSLESFAGNKCKWPSYTLVSERTDKFSRYWFVLWENEKWILWTKASSKKASRNAKIIMQKSGLVQIKFVGDAGVSTPIASLVQYRVGNKYFCVERFVDSDVMFFSGQQIQKPRVAKKKVIPNSTMKCILMDATMS